MGGGGRRDAPIPTSGSAPSRGMKLGKKSTSLLESLKTDTGPDLVERGPGGAPPMPAGPTESLTVCVEEKGSRFLSQDESDVPLLINCWPTPSGSETFVNIEYEATDAFDLREVQIYIPVGTSECPAVNSIEEGDYRFDGRNGCLLWEIPLVDGSNRSGSMEFVVPACDTEAFFHSNRNFCPVKVAEVVNLSNGSSVEDREVSV